MPSRLDTLTTGTRAAEAAVERLRASRERVYTRVLADLGAMAARRFASLAAAGEWRPPSVEEVLASQEAARMVEAAAAPGRAALVRAAVHPIIAPFHADYQATNPHVRHVARQLGRHITGVAETERQTIMAVVEQAYQDGLSIPKTARAIRDVTSGETALARASAIARTEVATATNAGALAAVRITGAATHKRWLATNDSRTRPDHDEADGQVVPVSDPFIVGGFHMLHPGDQDAPADEVVNCRCTMTWEDRAGEEADTPDGETNQEGDSLAADARRRRMPRHITLTAAVAAPAAAPADAPESGGVAAPQPSPAPADAAAGAEPGATWSGPIAFEDVETSDGRIIDPGALTWRTLPLTLMAQTETSIGHDGAGVAGRIDDLVRSGQQIDGTGIFDGGEFGTEVQRLVAGGFLRGVSIDLGEMDVVWEPVPEDPAAPPKSEEEILEELLWGPPMRMRVTKGEIMGATLTPFPAFADANISLVASRRRRSAYSNRFTFPLDALTAAPPPPPPAKDAPAKDAPEADPAAEVNTKAAALAADYPGLDGDITVTIDGAATKHAFPAKADAPADAPAKPGVTASAAGLAPLHPPAEWFAYPGARVMDPDRMPAVTVTPDGRVYGYVALWGTCHIGIPDECVAPPRSASNYAFYRRASCLCADETEVATGVLTLGTSHAPLGQGHRAASEHYDHTGTAVADVVCGEDEHGIWFSGALRPTVDEERVRELRGACVSGDWRSVGGDGLEMVGLLAVNVPGFVPKPQARVIAAAGHMRAVALVAASGIPVVDAEAKVRARQRAVMMRVDAQGVMAGVARRVGVIR